MTSRPGVRGSGRASRTADGGKGWWSGISKRTREPMCGANSSAPMASPQRVVGGMKEGMLRDEVERRRRRERPVRATDSCRLVS